jgi:hypothetical protein
VLHTLQTPQPAVQEAAQAQQAQRQSAQRGYLSRGGGGGGERADRGSLVAMTPSPLPGGYWDRPDAADAAERSALSDTEAWQPGTGGAGDGGGGGMASGGGLSPLMTWGEVVGTPLCLDPSQTPLAGSSSSNRSCFGFNLGSGVGESGSNSNVGMFRIGAESEREALARSLEAQTAAKKAKRRRRAEDELARLTGRLRVN